MAELNYDYLSSLVIRAQNGSTDAFAELYMATCQKQYWFTCQFLKDPCLAQDVLQEVYILALKNIRKLKNPRLFISWLNQINFRTCFDMKEKNYREQNELLLDQPDFTPPRFLEPSEDPVETKSRSRALFDYIKALPRKEMQAVLMKFYNEMTFDEIAYAMDCSTSSVKRYLKKGVESLRKIPGLGRGLFR